VTPGASSAVADVRGREVLDSRGRPTVEARCVLAGGAAGRASVPSGASTGAAEAVDRRDGGPRYRGLGCRQAAAAVGGEIRDALAARAWDQRGLDSALVELDATPGKARLGANAILAVSLAFARASAAERGVELWRHFADVAGEAPATLPRPTINLLSGGKHAGGQVEVQDVLVVPASAATVDEALATTFEVYACAAELARERYGARALTADEGGLAPEVPDAEAMLDLAVAAVERAGLRPGGDVALAVDVAASHFREGDGYRVGARLLPSTEMIERVVRWLDAYPIVSVEDALAEDDWAGWAELRRRVGGRALVLGDDLLCTNPALIARAVSEEAADALLLKVNQIGTLTEAGEARALARRAGWAVTVSARSGETEDAWLADLAVGWSGDQLKVGSITQSERLAKWNRLLEIEAESGLPMVAWPG
jgi:enolase